MAGRRLLNADGKFINNNKVAVVVAQNNDNLSKLISGEVKKVGFSGTNASDAAAANATKEAEKSRIKAMDAAHYSLTGQAAREQQDLSWYQRLDMSTVGGNTRHDKGGIDSSGDYVDQEFMSFKTKDNFIPGKTYTTNLRSKKDIELFGDSADALNEINFGEGSDSLKNLKDQERLVESIIDGVDFNETDSVNHKLGEIKKQVAAESTLGEVVDQRNIFQKAGDAIDDFTKPAADLISKKVGELYDGTVIETVHKHYKPLMADLKGDVIDLGEGAVEFGTQYVDAVQSIYTAVDGVDDNFIKPSELADLRAQNKIVETLRQEKEAAQQKRIDTGLAGYYDSRVEGVEIQTERTRKEAEAHALEILSNEKAHTHRQQVLDEWNTEQEIAAFEAQLKTDLAIDESKKIAESKRQRIADVKEREAKIITERENKRQNDRIDDIANKSDVAAKLAAEKKTKEQIAAHDKYQNDRIDNIANKSDADATYRKFQADEKAKNKLKKDLESADRIGSKMDRDNDRSFDPLIGGDPYAFSNFSYPLDVTNNNENGHYILFYVNVQNKSKYQYMTPKGVTVGDYVETPGYFEASSLTAGDVTNIAPSERRQNKYVEATTSNSAAAGEIDYQRQNVKNGGKGNILHNNMKILQKSRKAPYAGINSRYPTTTRITDSVALYLPPGIGNTLGAKYGDAETGVAGYLVLSGIDIVNDVKNLDFAGATDKLFGVGGTIIKEAVKKIGITAFEGLTETSGLTQSFDKIFGQASNPYIEVVFDAMNMRTFEYAFSFAPTSARETDEVKAIIQLFRFHMAPEMKGAAHRYLTLPSTFDIHYMFQSGMDDAAVAKENSFYNKIATCVLTSVDINYTPNDEIQSFADGAPTQINMALSFKETEMLTKEKINDGF